MSSSRFELNLDLESAQALRDLSAAVVQAVQDMGESTRKLWETYSSCADALGVHAAAFEELFLLIGQARRDSEEALQVLPEMMNRTADKIETYVYSHLDQAAGRAAAGPKSAGAPETDRGYTKRLSQKDADIVWQSAVESVDQQIENYRDALHSRGVPDCPWLEQTLAKHRARMLQHESRQLELARGHGTPDHAAEYKYPKDYKVFYDQLAHDFHEYCLRGANPYFGSGTGQAPNCLWCAPAYEMRRRGLEVTANPSGLAIHEPVCQPYSVWKDPEIRETQGNGIEDIRKTMNAWGDGARAQVVLIWNDGFGDRGHVFVAEQKGHKTVFFDPAAPDKEAKLYFAMAAPDRTTFCRIDNLEPSERMAQCCIEKEPV